MGYTVSRFKKPTAAQREEIIDTLAGTSTELQIVADSMGLDVDDVGEVMTDYGYQWCSVCHCCVEVGELNEENQCGDCR